MSDAPLNDAIQGLVGEGEIVVGYTMTVEVVGQDDARYLMHRHGSSLNGVGAPTIWAVVGWLKAATASAESQLYTRDPEEE